LLDGQFARQAGVSVKTVRYYASIGLLTAAAIDPASRYRYFNRGQLNAVARIRELREAGFTIREIKRWLDAGDSPMERLAILETVKCRLQLRLADDTRRLDILEGFLQKSPIPTQAIIGISVKRHVIREPAYTIRDRVRSTRGSVYRMFELAEQVVARHDARSSRKPFLLMHDASYAQSNTDVEICVPIVQASVSAVGGRWVEGAKRAVCQSYSGTYEQGPAVFDSIASWTQQKNLHRAGPVRETYLRYGADLRGYRLPKSHFADCVAKYRTELQIPIA
jgi:DNA-binding transcriptional MerR regulator